MKHVKLKILIIIWVAITTIFIISLGLVNILIPKTYEKEAVEALKYEMEYIELAENSNDGFYPEYEETFLSGNIYFLQTGSKDDYEKPPSKNEKYKLKLYNEKKDILESCDVNSLKEGEIQKLVTDDGYYIFVRYHDVFKWGGEPEDTIMYININPLLKNLHSTDRILLMVYVTVIAVMSIIGYRLGSDIDKSRETSQIFFQNASHELKTPLMIIQGYAEGIQTGVVDSESGAEIIMRESDKLTVLTDEILAISRIDANRLELKMLPTDVCELLYDSIRYAEQTKIEKEFEMIPEFPDEAVLVYCDEEQMAKVFKNVIMNAVRHCRKTILVLCRCEKNEVIITIKDDGSGITPEEQKHIFERFYAGHEGNTGIGLSLSKEILALHNGKISAFNEVGAVFEIRLPLYKK